MAAEQKDVLYGIELVVLTELSPDTQQPKPSGVVCRIETGDNASLEPVISEGEETVHRTRNRILGIARTEDLLYGYNMTFKDTTFDPAVAGLISGGKVTGTGTSTVIEDAKLADGATMKPFRAEIYIGNYEGDAIVNYAVLTLNYCKGKAPKFAVGAEFFAPEFEIKAREATIAGLPIKKISYVDELPSAAVHASVEAKSSK